MAATAAPALAIAFWRNALGALPTAGVVGLRHRAELFRMPARAIAGAALAGCALAAHFRHVGSERDLDVRRIGNGPRIDADCLHRRDRTPARSTAAATGLARHRGRHNRDRGSLPARTSSCPPRALAGDLLAIAGGLFAAIYLSIGARVRTHMSTATYTGVCYAVCSGVLLLVCLVGRVPLAGYPVNAWLKIVLVTICAQLLGHSLLNVVLRSTSPTVISLAILVEVPGAAIVAYVWLGQHPPLSAIPGLILLVGGLALVVRSRTRQRSGRDDGIGHRDSGHHTDAETDFGGMLATMTETLRPRRSCLAVPGSNPRFLEKAKSLAADQVFLDLEDACAPLVKPAARKNIVAALNEGGWGNQHPRGSGERRDHALDLPRRHRGRRGCRRRTWTASCCRRCKLRPRCSGWISLLTQIEKTMGFEVGRIGIEAQIENAQGLIAIDAIAAASPVLRRSSSARPTSWRRSTCSSLVVGEQPPGLRRRRRVPPHPDVDSAGRSGP